MSSQPEEASDANQVGELPSNIVLAYGDEVITIEEVSERLNSWAGRTRFVQSGAFPSDLRPKGALWSRATLTRIIESRLEEAKVIPGKNPPALLPYDDLAHLSIDPPSDVDAHEWHFIRNGTANTQSCRKCINGQVDCGACDGAKGFRCPE